LAIKGFAMQRVAASITLAFLVFSPHFSLATDVGGIINTDTTWDLAGSPYNLTSTVQVAEGVTLTVEPGVIINRGEQVTLIEFWGSLWAVGTDSNKIFFNGITLDWMDPNTSMRIEFVEMFGGGQIYGSDLTLKNSILRGSDVYLRYGGDCYVEQNIFYNASLGIQNHSGLNIVRNNVFYRDIGSSNAIFITAYCSDPTIEYNSFLNTDLIAIYLSSGDVECAVIATNNYWNTTDTGVIDSMIYDRNDNLTIDGYVVYTPFLNAPHPDTPPNASFEAYPTVGQAPLTVNFTDESILAITSWGWDFGDGSTSSQQNPSHTYTNLGSYTVSLTVTDILGIQDTYSHTITLRERVAIHSIPLLLLDD